MIRSSVVSYLLPLVFLIASSPQLCGEPPAGKQRTTEKTEQPFVLVGAVKVDITPDYPVRLTGYGNRTKESEGVAQRIWARAVVIGGHKDISGSSGEPEDDRPAVLLTADNCGIQEPMIEEVARRLAAKAGIKRERIACCSTHTHCAPMVNGFAPFILGGALPPEHQRHIDRYTQEVIDKLTQAALEALAARKPARLSWGAGTVRFAMNRRAMKDGRYTGFGEEQAGPVDHRLPILAAQDADGKLIAVVANYACHCTTLTGDFNQIHGDWAGCALEMLEADHPGTIALQTI
ncbi:MAG TPA: neutral/alkaline non-lysosomal ceramidase N-terminal domain-containing protein, partial [Pirellulales bacterium]|nr:neutral/alkaline non-lysosomal ceramidase N-terminal domain-containing protein [Pirellulales bacterium]